MSILWSKSIPAAQAHLNLVTGGNGGTCALGLYTQLPKLDGSDPGIEVPTSSGYARQPVTWGYHNASNSDPDVHAYPAGDVIFGPGTADWGNIVGVGVFLSGSLTRIVLPHAGYPPIDVPAGYSFTLPGGDIYNGRPTYFYITEALGEYGGPGGTGFNTVSVNEQWFNNLSLTAALVTAPPDAMGNNYTELSDSGYSRAAVGGFNAPIVKLYSDNSCSVLVTNSGVIDFGTMQDIGPNGVTVTVMLLQNGTPYYTSNLWWTLYKGNDVYIGPYPPTDRQRCLYSHLALQEG